MRRDRPMTEVVETRTPTREGVLRAAEKVAALLPPTPLLPFEIGGAAVWAKAECLQPIGAFKIRGAWHRISDLTDEERARGIVGEGDGVNAWLGWAYVAARVIHSLVQATVNRVAVRFAIFVVSSLILAALIVRAALALT